LTINWELIVPIIIAALGGGAIGNAIVEYIRQRNQGPVTKAQSEEILSEAWERVMKEYARQIENLRRLEIENSELRPLVLKIALQEQAMTQCHEDKEDWKRYATKLSKQLEEHGQMPIPFKRYPSGDSDKIAAIMSIEESPTIKKENGT
jgi:hypothetical protein